MPTYVVLLRGVNVGKAKRVPMAAFKDVLLQLGCTRAETLLNSGNAVVLHPQTASPALAMNIVDALADRFGFEVPVIVKSSIEFAAVVAGNKVVVAEDEHAKLLVAFGQSPQAVASLAPLAALVSPPEQFQRDANAAYLFCAGGILESKAGKALVGKLGTSVTTRNWSTVLKLQALAGLAGD